MESSNIGLTFSCLEGSWDSEREEGLIPMLNDIFYGFSVAFTFQNLIYCFLGVLMGTLVGVLPGLGPVAAMSLLFGSTLHIPPVSGMIMLAGIYYGAQYGGSTTSILLNIPGEASSVVTCLDGYQMARQGRAGPALGISAFGSFIGGTLSVVGLMLVAPPLANFALKFGFPENFSLMCLGLVIVSFLARGSMLKAMMMASLWPFLRDHRNRYHDRQAQIYLWDKIFNGRGWAHSSDHGAFWDYPRLFQILRKA